MSQNSAFQLDLQWWPATRQAPQDYVFTLRHRGTETLRDFTLCVTGHVRIDAGVPIDNAVLRRALSNFAEIAPPEGLVLHPGQDWRFVVHATSRPLHHWTEAAQAAYLVPSDGTPIDVPVGLCVPRGEPVGTPRFGAALEAGGTLTDGLALIPWPRHVAVAGTAPVEAGLCLQGEGEGPGEGAGEGEGKAATHAIAAFTELCDRLFTGERLVDPAGRKVRLIHADLPAEAYRVRFAPAEVTLEASSSPGFLHGLVTLGQCLRAARGDPHARFPRDGEIADAPEFGWRGVHLDVARQFYPLPELEHVLAILAWNKLNRLHLHLTDDEAWRFEVKAYPELIRDGAVRGHGLALPPLLGSGAARYGGSYTQAELRALVALAARWHIDIMPEIDMPGHCTAALAALPWLRDPDETGEYLSIQVFPNNCLNPASPRVDAFAATVFAELLDVFPTRWIHVGGDEVPEQAWSGSPLARARLAEGNAQTLQAKFLRRLQRLLRRSGRVTAAWEEAVLGCGVTPEGALLFAWTGAEVAGQLAARGYDVVTTPAQVHYLNMALAPDWWEPGASWAGWSSVADTYSFDPRAGFAPADLPRLKGVQCCIWSEQMGDRRVFQRLVFPRLSAVAETAWTAPARKSWPRFAAAARFMPTLHEAADSGLPTHQMPS